MTAIEKRIQKLLRSVTRAREVDVALMPDKSFQVEIHFKAQTVKLRVLWAGEGWPDDVQRVLTGDAATTDSETVVLARQLAPGSLEMLRGLSANWADETGAAHIESDRMTVVRDGTSVPVEVDSSQPGKFQWSNSSVDVAETILSIAEEQPLRIGEIAKTTGWSTPQVSNVLRAFERQGWVQSTGSKRGRSANRILADKIGLLNSWSERIAEKPAERLFAHAMTDDLMGLLRRELKPKLDQLGQWAITGWAGGELLAPFTSIVPVLQIYVEETQFSPHLIRSIGLTRVDEGGTIEFRSAGPVPLQLATRTSDHLRVASPARVFADLKSLGGRGADAANHLLSESLEGRGTKRPLGDLPEMAGAELRDWEQSSRSRLLERMSELSPDQRTNQYKYGSWTASYKLRGIKLPLNQADLLEHLIAVTGRETGWPPWLANLPDASKPQSIDGMIECWQTGVHSDHADFWRASPDGSMFLLRTFDEDSRSDGTEPGREMSLTLPVWRTGECLLHAQRLAERLGADQIDFMMRWEGLRNRELSAKPANNRWMPPGRVSVQNVVTSTVRTAPTAIGEELPSIVRNLVEPLYASFDFFQPPDSLYDDEINKMLERVR